MTSRSSRVIGRPRKTAQELFYDKQLHALLVERLPEKYIKSGKLDTKTVAIDCDVTRMTVYRWLNDLAMSKRNALKLIEISKGALSDIDMIPYVLRA
jgi:DNA invertase Pin-like site-specific DNA recombinase